MRNYAIYDVYSFARGAAPVPRGEEGTADEDVDDAGGSVKYDETLYEPPDAYESSDHGSPARTDDSDLSSSTVSPSPAARSGDEGLS